MRRISLKIAALVTLVTLATAAPVLASSSSTMPPSTTPTLGLSTSGDDAVERGVDPDGREGTGSFDGAGLDGAGAEHAVIESPGLAKFNDLT